jgi:hypothetical protein
MAKVWMAVVEGKQHGPLSNSELKSLADGKRLQPTDLVWKDGMAEWVPASKIKGLFPTAPPPLPTSPAPPAADKSPDVATAAKDLFGAFAGAAKRAGSRVREAAFSAAEQPPAAADEQPTAVPVPPKLSRRTLIGASVGGGALLLSCVVCGVIGAVIGNAPSGMKVQGDTVTFPVTLRSTPFGDGSDTAAFEMAQQVWEAAKAHPAAKKCVVKVTMSKQGVEDKYGKAWDKDEEMGEVVIGDLDEVRRYADSGAYSVNDFVRAQFVSQIRGLKYSNLLGVKR